MGRFFWVVFCVMATAIWAQTNGPPNDSIPSDLPVLVGGGLDSGMVPVDSGGVVVAGSTADSDSIAGVQKNPVAVFRDSVPETGIGNAAPLGDLRDEAKQKLTETASRVGDIFSLGNIIVAVFILIMTYVSIRLTTWVIALTANRFGQSRLKLMMLVPVVRILFWMGAVYVIIVGIFSPSADALLAFSASAGIAVGFASQDILKNIFGGILIVLDRPFQVGDKIQVGSHYGEVVNIGLRTVRIVTHDDSLISIPNSELMNQAVSNSNSGALDCQVVTEFYLPADVDIDLVKKLAYEAAATSKFVYFNKPIVVRVQDDFKEGFLTKLKVKAYVLDTRFEAAFSSDVSERAKAAFIEAGIYQKPFLFTQKPQE